MKAALYLTVCVATFMSLGACVSASAPTCGSSPLDKLGALSTCEVFDYFAPLSERFGVQILASNSINTGSFLGAAALGSECVVLIFYSATDDGSRELLYNVSVENRWVVDDEDLYYGRIDDATPSEVREHVDRFRGQCA